MSQDRLSNLFPNRVTEEAVPPTPTAVTMPQIIVVPSAPHLGLADGGQSYPDSRQILEVAYRSRTHPFRSRYAPSCYRGGLPRASPSSTCLDEDDTGYHPPYSSARLDDGSPPIGAPATLDQPRGVLGTLSASPTWPNGTKPSRGPV
ncbi:hypothetical protein B296_00006206 [Ensete ventricosum]|uniref:Uncharacterized protein n=1 Tax=Ensete ventricosum TaxID=4639 RepID=A0A427B8J3_ENSVE|nr:hypothetical protein B296_00006206 [Ensete ventricosum]